MLLPRRLTASYSAAPPLCGLRRASPLPLPPSASNHATGRGCCVQQQYHQIRQRHDRRTAPRSTHITKHDGKYAGSADDRLANFVAPPGMSKSTARRLANARVAAIAGKKAVGRNTGKQPLAKAAPGSSFSLSSSRRLAKAEDDAAELSTPPVEKREFKVEFSEHGIRMDSFLERRLGLRKNVARLKVLNGEVSVVGSAHARFVDLKPAGTLAAGDVVVVIVLAPRRRPRRGEKGDTKNSITTNATHSSEQTRAEQRDAAAELDAEVAKMKKRVLFKDKDLIVLDKPRGLAVQGGSKIGMHLDKILEGMKFEDDVLGADGVSETPRLVHRLDRDTTGALLLARNAKAAARIGAMLKNASGGAVVKSYIAVLVQAPVIPRANHAGADESADANPQSQPSPPSDDFHEITTGMLQVGRTGVEKMSIVEWYDQDEELPDPNVKKATTRWRILDSKKQASLVELQPATGRKHQLRVHCSMVLKASIFGDYKYGVGCTRGLRGVSPDPTRVPLHLHMRELTLKDWYGPGAHLQVTAPIPPHMRTTMKHLDLRLRQE
ncbi:hypothetical protein HDU88_000500 [Geranomyces variabilis]|nr:hypothetical protein HDU88_000500 [Geranomyces variabilis]